MLASTVCGLVKVPRSVSKIFLSFAFFFRSEMSRHMCIQSRARSTEFPAYFSSETRPDLAQRPSALGQVLVNFIAVGFQHVPYSQGTQGPFSSRASRKQTCWAVGVRNGMTRRILYHQFVLYRVYCKQDIIEPTICYIPARTTRKREPVTPSPSLS